jgi:hypothetical protein
MRRLILPTFTGGRVDLLDPSIESMVASIRVEDIAHALSNDCRYNGHTSTFYSVAEHSVRLALVVQPEWKVWALFHDASEAYLRDIPRQVKMHPMMTDYNNLQRRWEDAINRRFNIQPASDDAKRMDLAMVSAECKHAKLVNWRSLAQIDTAMDPNLIKLGGEIFQKLHNLNWHTKRWGWEPALAKDLFIRMTIDLLVGNVEKVIR